MSQRYISKELFHFIGQKKPKDEQYEIMKKILSNRQLGISDRDCLSFKYDDSQPLSSNEVYTPQMVCFCDIPIEDLRLHINKYSSFGISFLKEYLLTKGVNPIWYISKKSTTDSRSLSWTNEDLHNRLHKKFKNVFNELREIKKNTPEEQYPEWCKNIEELSCYFDFRVFSFMKFFDAEKEDTDNENYYMEREWRLLGRLNFETIENINRIILPRSSVKKFRQDFPAYNGQINFSNN